jgi:DNA-binding response OmpR family regulator
MYLQPLRLPKPRILVLEDDSSLRAGLRALLAASGYALTDDGCGADVARRVDLVIAGVGAQSMPAMALQQPDHAAPVILLVDRKAWTGFDFFDAANALGAVAVLQRPFSRAALLSLIASVLSGGARDADSLEPETERQPGLAELLLRLENPNFA